MMAEVPKLAPEGSIGPWAGMRAVGISLEFELVGADGTTIDRTTVANTPRAVLRLVKHWHDRKGIDPGTIVFCTDAAGLTTGGVLQWMMERGWTIVRADRVAMEAQDAEGPGSGDLRSLVRRAMRSNGPLEVMDLSRLHLLRLERLRDRRDRLLALRSDLHEEMNSRRAMFEEELAREFERLDRRHVQVIDKIILRLEVLIGLQMRGA